MQHVRKRTSTPSLELERVTAGYSQDIDIIQDLSLSVPTGELRGLIGLNGSGKSTLLKTILGFLRPKHGDVRLDGTSLLRTAPHECLNAGLFLIPQESSLFPHLSVEANLNTIVRVRGGGLDEVYARFPVLKEFRRSKVGNLSGGQQKMVEFAKAVLARPRVLLIDEPSIGLAPQIAQQVYGWIEEFAAQNISILLVDHNIMRVLAMVDYMYILNLGRITAEGPPEKFRDNVRDQVSTWLGL